MPDTPPPSTLDPAEVEKFAALAAEWWRPDGPFAALHRMNPVRLQFIRERVSKHFAPPRAGDLSSRDSAMTEGVTPPTSRASRDPLPPQRGGRKASQPLSGLTALDLGCGGGLVSAPLSRLGAKVTGVDAGEEAIGAARVYAEQAGLDIDFRVSTAEALAASGEQFDLVCALEIIEHVADVPAFLEAAATLVKPGGMMVLSTINRTPKARALAIVGAEKILKWAPEGAHDYDKLVTPEEIRAGGPSIRWEEPTGISYEPLGKGWTLSRDVSVNYLVAGTKPTAAAHPTRD